jgi:hypothetical protein
MVIIAAIEELVAASKYTPLSANIAAIKKTNIKNTIIGCFSANLILPSSSSIIIISLSFL